MIYLDNSIEFYPIELIAFIVEKGIHLKPIVLKVLNQNSPIEQIER